MIKLHAAALKDAAKLLNRVRSRRCTLPVLTHILVSTDSNGVTLAVTDLDIRLETRLTPAEPCDTQESFLIPADALAAALKADKGSVVSFTRKGAKGERTLALSVTCGGMRADTLHPTLDVSEFPEHPLVLGQSTVIPARTIEMLGTVAGCASTDQTRYVLNGVYFTPDDGGMVVATNGKQLAAAPATVPETSFILPSAAAHVLGHPDFLGKPSEVTVGEVGGKDTSTQMVMFRSGDRCLISTTISGSYPTWKQNMPREMVASVTIPEARRPAVIAWLRAKEGSVNLLREKRGTLVMTHTTRDGATSTIEVPVESTGAPTAITLNATYLADALQIAPTLWIADEMTPVAARRADGVFCVFQPMRSTQATARPAAATPAPSATTPAEREERDTRETRAAA